LPPEDIDRLHGELDRQLAEVRTACDGLATRSGLLVAAIAAVAAVFAGRINPKHHWDLLLVTAIALGVAALAGASVLMPWLKTGPVTEVLQDWINTASARTSSELYLAKNTILGANRRRMVVMRTLFTIQAIVTIVAIGVSVVRTLTQLSGGGHVFGPPKSDAGQRTIAFPDLIADDLTWHLGRFAPPGGDALVSQARPARCWITTVSGAVFG